MITIDTTAGFDDLDVCAWCEQFFVAFDDVDAIEENGRRVYIHAETCPQ